MFVLYPGKREMRFDEIQRYNLSSLRPGHDAERETRKNRRLAGSQDLLVSSGRRDSGARERSLSRYELLSQTNRATEPLLNS